MKRIYLLLVFISLFMFKGIPQLSPINVIIKIGRVWEVDLVGSKNKYSYFIFMLYKLLLLFRATDLKI